MIKDVYKDYIQKSRVFMYPLLDIKRSSTITPIETYSSWENKYSTNDKKLICLYHLRNDPEFRTFEKVKLFGNKRFHDFAYLSEDKAVYIFDMSDSIADYDLFINGSYSKFNETHKKKILSFYNSNKSNLEYIDSFLFPENYYDTYAEILSINKSDINEMKRLLKDTVELCEKPDISKETLNANYKILEIQ